MTKTLGDKVKITLHVRALRRLFSPFRPRGILVLEVQPLSFPTEREVGLLSALD